MEGSEGGPGTGLERANAQEGAVLGMLHFRWWQTGCNLVRKSSGGGRALYKALQGRGRRLDFK